MNIIYGLYRADSGAIRLKGHEIHFASPRGAIRAASAWCTSTSNWSM